MVAVNQCFKSLQGKETIFDDQNRQLDKLVDKIEHMIQIKSELSTVKKLAAVMEKNFLLQHNSMAVHCTVTVSFAKGLSSFLCSTMNNMDEPSKNEIYKLFS